MVQYDSKEDYLEQVKGQIRCKKARSMIVEEINQHIEDQRASIIKEGYDDNIATVKALEQMGDPTEVGKQLDKIHKPSLEWRILLAVLALCSFGILAQLSINNVIDESKFYNSIDVARHIFFIVAGLLIVLAVYYIDYSVIGMYPKILWLLLLTVSLFYASVGAIINGQLRYFYVFGMLLIPLYGGILYAYHKKGYIGMLKCLLLCIVTSFIEMQFTAQSAVYIGLLLSCLIMLSAAVMKNWFGTSKKVSLAIIWGWLPICGFALIISGMNILRPHQAERISSIFNEILHPELYARGYQMNLIRQAISHSRLFGGTTDEVVGYIPSLNTDNILAYVISKWGIIAGALVIGMFVILIGRMIYISYHQKNSLGMFVGLGCSLVFAVQGTIYILSNLGLQL
ncbi:MAG TPA: FtsW/RodA/SpoVE family cell cycle protein, partial [Mobilitalea sp.]|nr:FtsW/RodA/SpoVE family cell cycle protein [Mobilitalea sp.]